MPLQNRVDPFGDIHAVEWRGMFTGNRGVIHDPDTKTLLRRRWATKAWIICSLRIQGTSGASRWAAMRRSGNAGWTELFFLDEVTALAAGHRPCFYCRREAAKEFVRCYGEAFGVAKPKSRRRSTSDCTWSGWLPGGRPAALEAAESSLQLPDGAMVAIDGQGSRAEQRHGYAPGLSVAMATPVPSSAIWQRGASGCSRRRRRSRSSRLATSPSGIRRSKPRTAEPHPA